MKPDEIDNLIQKLSVADSYEAASLADELLARVRARARQEEAEEAELVESAPAAPVASAGKN
jgi:uncharacterized protein YigA (DUF484 family)